MSKIYLYVVLVVCNLMGFFMRMSACSVREFILC